MLPDVRKAFRNLGDALVRDVDQRPIAACMRGGIAEHRHAHGVRPFSGDLDVVALLLAAGRKDVPVVRNAIVARQPDAAACHGAGLVEVPEAQLARFRIATVQHVSVRPHAAGVADPALREHELAFQRFAESGARAKHLAVRKRVLGNPLTTGERPQQLQHARFISRRICSSEALLELLQRPGVALVEVLVRFVPLGPIAEAEMADAHARSVGGERLHGDYGPGRLTQLDVRRGVLRRGVARREHPLRFVADDLVRDGAGPADALGAVVAGPQRAANPEINFGKRHHPGLDTFFGGEGSPDLVQRRVDDDFMAKHPAFLGRCCHKQRCE